MRRNLFAKLGLTFLALLISAMLAVGLLAERALRRDFERTAYSQLTAVAGIAQARASALPSLPPVESEDDAKLRTNGFLRSGPAGRASPSSPMTAKFLPTHNPIRKPWRTTPTARRSARLWRKATAAPFVTVSR